MFNMFSGGVPKNVKEFFNDLTASASEINESVNNTFKFVIGDNLYDLHSETELLNIEGFTGSFGDGTPIFQNSNLNTKYSNETLELGNTTLNYASTYTDRTKNLPATLDMSDIDIVTFWVYVPEEDFVDNGYVSSDWGSVRVLFNDSNGNYSGTRFADSLNISLQNGWNNISIPKSKFTVNSTNSVNWGNITSIRLQCGVRVGNIGTNIYIDSLIVGSQKLDKIPIVVTLDDGTKDTYDMAKIMNKYGIPISTFVTPEYIDGTNSTYLNIEHLEELYHNGNHIGIHGTGINDFALNPSNILIARDWLIEKGFTRDNGQLYGTYPNGGYSQATIDLLRNNGFKGFRQVVGKNRDDNYDTQPTKGGLPFEFILNGGIADVLKISGERPNTSTDYINRVNEAIEYQAGYIPYHHLFSEIGGRAEWETVAKYLKTKIDDGTIECLTFPQFCKKYSN